MLSLRMGLSLSVLGKSLVITLPMPTGWAWAVDDQTVIVLSSPTLTDITAQLDNQTVTLEG